MELPFLKKKQNQGGGAMPDISREPDMSNDDSLMDSIGQEFLDAIERKDIKALRAALEALVIQIKSMDQSEDMK